MRAKKEALLIASVFTVLGIMMIPNNASAEDNQDSITITPINEEISLKKTTTSNGCT